MTVGTTNLIADAYDADGVWQDRFQIAEGAGVRTGSATLSGSFSKVTWYRTSASGLVGVGALDYKPVPEPGTLALLGLGLMGIGWRALRRRQ